MELTALADILFPDTLEKVEDIEKRFPKRDLPEGAKVTRIAPSPTGFMHLGNLYGALADERLAHQSGGVFYLRIEDTDSKREVEGGVQKILDVFSDYGLQIDEGVTADGEKGNYGPYRQRQRKDIYTVFAKKLVSIGRAYPCFCTEDELSAARENQTEAGVNGGYYGAYAKCAGLSAGEAAERVQRGDAYVLRFRSCGESERRVKFTDMLKGDMEFPENDMDIVLLKSDGIPTYHFAHVVDDYLMRTTHVIRGEEWLATLPVHLQIFKALDLRPPKYIHTAHLLKREGESKRKLSKRKDPELALDYYRQHGYSVKALKEYIMTLLNSSYEEWRLKNPFEPLESYPFTVKKMGVSGALFDIDKLNDISRNVLSTMSAAEIFEGICDFSKQYDEEFYKILTGRPDYSEAILKIGRGGPKPRKDLTVYSDAKEYMGFFYDELFRIKDEYPENIPGDMVKIILNEYADSYTPASDSAQWFAAVKELAVKLSFAPGVKEYKENPDGYPGHAGDVSMVIRVALTGKRQSPDLFEVVSLLGRERVIERLRTAAESL